MSVCIIIFFQAIVKHYEIQSINDRVTRFEKSISLLKEKLPPHGIVGYFNDIEPETLYAEEYWRTQYVLSPIIIQKNLDHQFIVGVLHPSVPERRRYEGINLSLIEEFGGGIVLLKRNK